MLGALGLGLILFGAALIVTLFGERPLAGMAPDEAGTLLAVAAMALVMTNWIFGEFKHRWTDGIRALIVWGIAFAGLAAAYTQRAELNSVLDRMIGEVSPGRTVVTDTGEVVAARRADGSFTLAGHINGRETRFIFDTGASAVVLTGESAAASGFHLEALSFTVPVATANGRTLAAPVMIESLTIGPITERRIRALVARPGALRENLLGMTFLERLPSYEVRGNRLILRRAS
jgi:aspartyl protease family protein